MRCLVGLLAVLVLASAVGADTLYPDADTEVRSGAYADENYGSSFAPYVREQTSGTCNRAVFRFDLSSISGSITDAKLKLYVHSVGGADTSHRLYFMSDDSWVESAITWNNCPSVSSTSTTWSVTTSDADTWKEIDVTSLAQQEAAGDDELSVLIMADVLQNVLVQYRSKEYSGTTYDPYLEVTTSSNAPPEADAGEDDLVTDQDESGSETVTLDGSGSSDSDGYIVSWVWKEGVTQIATGETVQVSLAVGEHTITLTVTDDDDATDTDTVYIVVNDPPVADAGEDDSVTDTDQSGSETVTLDGSGSSDSDGSIVSWVWKEGVTQIATGSTAQVSLAVGQHTITLTVTDNEGGTDADQVVWTVNAGGGSETTLYPDADSEVRSGPYSDDNYGSSFGLYVREKSGGTCNRAVFRFDLSSISGTVTDATLKLYVNTVGNDASHRLYFMSDDSWVESTITWNNCPSVSSTSTTWSVATSDAGTWKEIDVTSLVQQEAAGDDELSVLVMADVVQNVLVQYYSKEQSGTTYDPQLVVTTGAGENQPPVADAGEDQQDWDVDENGSETITLDGSGSSDSDGSIVSWVWKEGQNQIATGETAQVSLAVGQHTITLIVTDDDDDTDDDTVVITVYESTGGAPVADAGDDAVVVDTNGDGEHLATLDGSGSSDDGSITSYVWTEGGSQVATGETAQITLSLGIHDLKLTVTDDEAQTAADFVRVWIMPQGDYFVDGTYGSDSNSGTEASPYKTIGKAVSMVSAGEVIIVKEGIYREQLSLPVNGSSGNEITLMGYPFDRVVISGADEVTGWTQCTSEIAKGNPNYANIYYVDIDWQPTRLVQDDYDVILSRQPANGMWLCTGGGSTTLVDTVHLTQADDYWNGAKIYLYNDSASVTYERNVTDFDAASDTLTVDSAWGETPEANVDVYYMANSVRIIDGAGQWAVEDIGGGDYRVYAWAYDGGDPDSYLMEASHRALAVNLGSHSYWTFDNLEVRHTTTGGGIYMNASGSYFTIQNCCVRHNDQYGILLTGSSSQHITVRHCYLAFNRFGVSCSSPYSLIEDNEVGWNWEDGIRSFSNSTVQRNYIHDHTGKNHPDNFQTFGTVSNLVLADNFMISAGQNLMMQGADGITFTNNVVIGSGAQSVIYGSGCTDATSENNTVLFGGYDPVNTPDDGGYFRNNIVVSGNGSVRCWGVADLAGYDSDYNCFWVRDGFDKSPVVWDSNWNWTWAQYQSGSGEDAHSYHADPLLASVPTYFARTDLDYRSSFTATKLYIPTASAALFAVDDHIEIDWDSVMRTVTSVGSNYIEFTPGKASVMDSAWMIANWKTTTSTALDLTLDAQSPAKGTADDSGDMGSSINIDDYMAGDFDGDGVRDIPVWPPLE